MGKHLTCLLALAIFIGIGAACKYSPFANGSSRYACEISGEPMPKTSEEFLKRAARHLADNNSAGYNECAFGAVSEAIKLDPANAEAYALRGSQHLEHRRIDAEKNDSAGLRRSLEMALSDLNKAIELDPKRSNFYAIRSSVYAESHYLGSEVQKKNVFDDLTRAIELGKPSETLALLFLRRGHFYLYEKNDAGSAIKDYTEGIKIDPDIEDLYAERSEAYRRLGEIDLARTDSTRVGAMRDGKIDNKTPNSTAGQTADPTSSAENLNDRATKLVQPAYPAAARAVRATGSVTVQVTIDEKGNVVTATATNGHPFLREAAATAARESKFAPTLKDGKAVKVSGELNFRFDPQ